MLSLLPNLIFRPYKTVDFFQAGDYTAKDIFLKFSLWLCFIPAVSSFIGIDNFGLMFTFVPKGGLVLGVAQGFNVALLYFLAALIGISVGAAIIQWMAETYGDKPSFAKSYACMTIIMLPFLLGGIVHLYPSVPITVMVLAALIAWNCYLLLTIIPTILGMNPSVAPLVGTAILTFFVTAFLSVLGIATYLWVAGIGVKLGV